MMRWRWCVVLLLGATAASGSMPSLQKHAAVQASLRHLPPNIRFYELDRLGLLPRSPVPVLAESGGLRLVGKWGAGPSVKVTGRDSLVFLCRGSQVVAINCADTANPRVLSYIEVNGLVSRSVLVGNRLYVGSTGSDPKYIDVFDVTDPANPQRIGQLQTRLLDIDVVDTLVFTVAKDMFRVFNFADPANPRQLGACDDTGYTLSVSNGYAYIADRWGLYVVDVRNPTSPQHVASWGSDLISVMTRGNICCVTTGNPNDPTWLQFIVLDVRTPTSPSPLSTVDSCGAYDIFLEDSLAFLSGYYTGGHGFRILSIADSSQPRSIGDYATRGDNFGVWANLGNGRAYVADHFEGQVELDITNMSAPKLARTTLGADMACDVTLDGGRAYVADARAGLQILDVTDPTRPTSIGVYDTLGFRPMYNTVAARDSFAFVDSRSGGIRFFRSVNVTNPADPKFAGDCELFNPPEDMALRDSLVYVAEVNRFQVVNVSRPRQPALVGSCVSTDGTDFGLAMLDAFAYVAGDVIQVIDVARPDSPRVVTTIGRASWNLSIVDSMLFCEPGPAIWYSLANPAVPVAIDSIDMGHWITAMTAVNRTIYACSGPSYSTLYAISIADLHQPRVITQASLPYVAKRITYAAPYLYLSCEDAGVCIYETTQVGIQEPSSRVSQRMKPMPTVVRGAAWKTVTNGATAFDAMGRRVTQAKPGVYFIREQSQAPGLKPQAVRKIVVTR